MSQQDAPDLIKKLLRAKDEDELMQSVSLHLSSLDGVFFGMANVAVLQLERDGRPVWPTQSVGRPTVCYAGRR